MRRGRTCSNVQDYAKGVGMNELIPELTRVGVDSRPERFPDMRHELARDLLRVQEHAWAPEDGS